MLHYSIRLQCFKENHNLSGLTNANLDLDIQEGRFSGEVSSAEYFVHRLAECILKPEVHSINRYCLHTNQIIKYLNQKNKELDDQGLDKMICITSKTAFQNGYVKINRDFTHGKTHLKISYGFPWARKGECEWVLSQILNIHESEIKPVPIPEFKKNDTIDQISDTLDDVQEQNNILMYVLIGIGLLILLIIVIIAIFYWKGQAFANRMTN